MSSYEELIKYAEKIVSNYIDGIRQEMNEKFDQIEAYQKIIVRNIVENQYNNSKNNNFNSLKEIIELENQIKFINLNL